MKKLDVIIVGFGVGGLVAGAYLAKFCKKVLVVEKNKIIGAASTFETIACCLALKFGEVPPTINMETPDPGCDVNCVPNHKIRHKMRTILNNSQAFGGSNASIVLLNIFTKELL